jgi:hypothetical protein
MWALGCFMWPRVCLLGLVLGLAAIASAQADPKPEPQSQPEYPVCNIPLAVGEVPNSPFLAELVDDSWTNAPDGRKIPVDSPDPQPGVVARDSKGRVMVKLPSKIAYTKSESDSNSEAKAESRGWSETICDPVAGTVTRMSYSDVFHRGEDPSTGESVLFPAGVAGNALVRPQVNFHTTVVFKYWHYVVKGREDLGPETFEGTPAYRFRSHPVQNGTSGHDTVNSDEIFVELAETRWGDEPGRENERKITHIRRGEPSATLFDIPVGVTAQDQRGQNQKRTTARQAD